MPNAVAYTALLLWPFITLAMFAYLKPSRAVIWSLLAGYLLLPVKTSFDFPGIPALDKTSIPNLAALVGALLFSKGPVARLPREWWVLCLMFAHVISPMFTVLTNRDPLFFGSLILPGLRPYDAFSAAAYKMIDLVPFLLGYNMLRDPNSQHEILRAFAIAALGYSLLMLVEIRLSPQLHNWIYGFFPHSFAQQVRDGGFRPVVFLGHGLLVAIFTAMSLVATAYLAQQRERLLGVSAWFWLTYLAGLLILCRSLGALLISSAFLAVMFTMNRQKISSICALAAFAVLIYPALRGADLVPVQLLANQMVAVSEERASSFQTRIDNENLLLARANNRPLFGWGSYGRNRVYDEYTGQDVSITDGAWIITAGSSGWAGYVAVFGLICLPIVAAWRRGTHLKAPSAAILLILTVNLLDLIPNSSLTSITWFLAGCLLSLPHKTAKSRQRPEVLGTLQ